MEHENDIWDREAAWEWAERYRQKCEAAEDNVRHFLASQLMLVNDTVHELTNEYPSPDVLATIAGQFLLTAMRSSNDDRQGI